MDILTKEEADSDIEIVEPEVLRSQFRHQQLRLIHALSICGCSIPKKWNDFEIFVKNVLKLYLSANLVKSVWLELCAIDRVNGIKNETVEISDEEDVKKNDTKYTAEKCDPVESEFYWKLKDSNSPLTVEISDDEQDNKGCSKQQSEKHLIEASNSLGSSDVETPLNEQSSSISNKRKRNGTRGKGSTSGSMTEEEVEASSSMSNKRKRNGTRGRGSTSGSMTEEEAEALREQLLMDKIIELELSKLIKSYMHNNVVTNGVKKKRRTSIKKRVINTKVNNSPGIPQ